MLDSDTRVEVQLRSGLKATGPISDFKWETVDGVSDIMMWRTNLLPETVRQFETGATRSPDVGRYDPEGFFSPLVFERFCEYMNAHRKQTDGSIRDSDNWQKGLPLSTYMKGGWRHFLHWWKRHRGFRVNDAMAGQNMEEDLCALLFNVQGYLHELLKQRESLVIKSTQTASES
jgi:hypothetical protein